MKNNYKKLSEQVDIVREKRADQQHVARLRTGVIEGGPSIDQENKEWEYESKKLCDMVEMFLENGARVSKIEEVTDGCPCIDLDPVIDQYRA